MSMKDAATNEELVKLDKYVSTAGQQPENLSQDFRKKRQQLHIQNIPPAAPDIADKYAVLKITHFLYFCCAECFICIKTGHSLPEFCAMGQDAADR